MRFDRITTSRHPSAGWGPASRNSWFGFSWMPAFAGMTVVFGSNKDNATYTSRAPSCLSSHSLRCSPPP